MNPQVTLGQDVLYRLSSNDEYPAKVVRVTNQQKGIVSLLLFTDGPENLAIKTDVHFDDAGISTPNTWRHLDLQGQARSAGR